MGGFLRANSGGEDGRGERFLLLRRVSYQERARQALLGIIQAFARCNRTPALESYETAQVANAQTEYHCASRDASMNIQAHSFSEGPDTNVRI